MSHTNRGNRRRVRRGGLLAAVGVAASLSLLGGTASAHTTAPTKLVVKSTTESSVSLDWSQDYVDSYDGYYVRVDGGARVRTSSSETTVTGLAAGTTYRFCASINFTSRTHPDESNQTCISAATKGSASPSPAPSPSPTPAPNPGQSTWFHGIWTKSTAPQADFHKVAELGFRHAQVDPNAAQLDRLAVAGLKPILWLGNYDDDNCTWRWSDSSLASKLNAVKGHPLLANGGADAIAFVADEPHSAASGGCASAPSHMRQRGQLVKSILPNVRTLITENRKEDYANLAKTSDVFGAIRYPCSYDKGCVLSKISETAAYVNAAGITNWWGVPQTFGEPRGGYYRAPAGFEMQQIIDAWRAQPGIDGLFAYTWGDSCCGDDVGMRDFPSLWPIWQAHTF